MVEKWLTKDYITLDNRLNRKERLLNLKALKHHFITNEKNQCKYDMDMFIYILDQTKISFYKLLIPV